MNADLQQGTTDGKYRKVRPDTTLGEPRNAAGVNMVEQERRVLHPFYGYGFLTTETPDRVTQTHL
jgi:hypothetical protein